MKQRIFIFYLLIIGAFAYAQNTKTIRIGILSDTAQEDQIALGNQLKKEIQAVVSSTDIIFENTLYNENNLQIAQRNYKKLIHSNVDIILSFGVLNHVAIDAAKPYQKPIIIVGTINADFIKLKKDQKTSQVDNLTYLIAPISYKDDLDTFLSIYDFQNIGIIVDEYLPNVTPITDFFDTYFSTKSTSYTLINATQPDLLISEIKGFDAIYLAGDFSKKANVYQSLIETLTIEKIPSFTSSGTKDVANGILATNQPEANIQQFFRRIALNVESIINGTNPKDLPIFVTYEKELSINFNTAKKIGFPLRYSMLGNVNFIGGVKENNTNKSYSITDIINKVLSDNISLNSTEKDVALITQEVKKAKSNFLPQVVANASSTYVDPALAEASNGLRPEFTTVSNLSLNQLIYSENAAANVTINKKKQKAQQETYNAAQLDIVLDASLAYFDALIAKTNTHIQNKNLQLTKKNLQISKQNFEAGESGKGDVLRFRSQLAQNTQILIEALNALEQRYYNINQLMNQKINNEIDIEEATIEEGIFESYNYTALKELLDDPKMRPALVDFLIEESKRNAPELKNIGYIMEANERAYTLNHIGRFVPTVSLQGQYNFILSQTGKGSEAPLGFPTPPDASYTIGLNLSLPLFQQNQRNINRMTAVIQRDQLKLDKENIELNLEASVNKLVLNLVNQIANIEISKISEETAKEGLELTQNSYAEGAVSIIQLIDAQNNYLQAQLTRATANYNYLLTSIQLERIIGYFFLLNTSERNQDFIQRANTFILNRN